MHQNQGERGCKSEGVGRERERKKDRERRGKKGSQKYREGVKAVAKRDVIKGEKGNKKDCLETDGENASKPGV